MNRSDDGGLTYGPAVIAAVGGNTTGNIAVDQRDGTVYFCHQGASPNGNQVQVAIGHSPTLTVAPVVYTNVVAATGLHNIANLFPVCKVASDGTVYVAYSDGGEGIYIAHSLDQGKSWAPPARVSDMGPNGVALFPWIETGERPGSLAIVWYGATAADSEDGKGGNTDNANWKLYFAETLNATSSAPTIFQSAASDHFIHGSNISLAGFTTGRSPNRNLADFFQVAVDLQGLAFVAFADDSNDFAGHSAATHQTGGSSLNTGASPRATATAQSPIRSRAGGRRQLRSEQPLRDGQGRRLEAERCSDARSAQDRYRAHRTARVGQRRARHSGRHGVGRLLGLDAWRGNVHNGLVSAVNAASVLRP